MAEAPVSSAQQIGWVISGLAIAASLAWNAFNWRHTNKKALETRSANFKSDQWASARARIEAALDSFSEAVESLLISTPKRSDPTFDDKFAPLNLTLSIKHGALSDALSDAQKNSLYISDRGWDDLAYGPLAGAETSWDRILSALDDVSTATNDEAAAAALASIKAHRAAVRQGIVDAVRIETGTHDPTPLY